MGTERTPPQRRWPRSRDTLFKGRAWPWGEGETDRLPLTLTEFGNARVMKRGSPQLACWLTSGSSRRWRTPAKKVADQAARPLRPPESRPLTVRLLGGLVLRISTLYCGPRARTGNGRGREGAGLYPELAVLGFSEGSSPALASRVARMTALLPSFQTARDELARDGVPLNSKEGS